LIFQPLFLFKRIPLVRLLDSFYNTANPLKDSAEKP